MVTWPPVGWGGGGGGSDHQIIVCIILLLKTDSLVTDNVLMKMKCASTVSGHVHFPWLFQHGNKLSCWKLEVCHCSGSNAVAYQMTHSNKCHRDHKSKVAAFFMKNNAFMRSEIDQWKMLHGACTPNWLMCGSTECTSTSLSLRAAPTSYQMTSSSFLLPC